jgi:DNA-binding NarL/FixJ family response regulator
VKIRVAIIEDDMRYRASLEALFRHAAEFAVGGSYGSVEAALRALDDEKQHGRLPPWDLVLMDLQLPRMDGIEGTRRIKALLPMVPVVVLTVFEEPRTVLNAISAGADGYLLKHTPPGVLVAELRSVMAGCSPLSAGVARTVLDLLRRTPKERKPSAQADGPSRLDLTSREQEVLRCLVQGMAYKQVARHLEISIDTVRSHIRNVYSKLQVHSVAQAVSRAIRERIV